MDALLDAIKLLQSHGEETLGGCVLPHLVHYQNLWHLQI